MKRTLDKLRFRTEVSGDVGDQWIINADGQNKFFDELSKESDRSAVLISASIFDEMLKSKLERWFIKGNKKSKDALFEFNGPFGSFSAKIETLYLLGDIDKSKRDDLHIIRKLRNVCAHNWDTFKFDEQIEQKFISNIKNYILFNADDMPDDISEYCCRTRFMFVCAYYLISLNYVNKSGKGASPTNGDSGEPAAP